MLWFCGAEDLWTESETHAENAPLIRNSLNQCGETFEKKPNYEEKLSLLYGR